VVVRTTPKDGSIDGAGARAHNGSTERSRGQRKGDTQGESPPVADSPSKRSRQQAGRGAVSRRSSHWRSPGLETEEGFRAATARVRGPDACARHRIASFRGHVLEGECFELLLHTLREWLARRRKHCWLQRVFGVEIGHVEVWVVSGELRDERWFQLAKDQQLPVHRTKESMRLDRRNVRLALCRSRLDAESLLWFLGEEAAQQRACLVGEPSGQLDFRMRNLLLQFLLLLVVPRRLAGDHLVQKHAARPDVHRLIVSGLVQPRAAGSRLSLCPGCATVADYRTQCWDDITMPARMAAS